MLELLLLLLLLLAGLAHFCSQKSSGRHRKDVKADSKDLDVGWANGQEMDRRPARC